MATRSVLFVALVLATIGISSSAQAERSPLQIPPELLAEPGFINHHPDLRWRERGREAYVRGEFALAAGYFRRSALHADKPSQAILGEMHLLGRGVERDPALAYVWLDLAAERGYRAFLGRREYVWASLDVAQQQRALELGTEMYAEFGDDVAKARLERELARGRKHLTGSRTGSADARKVGILTEEYSSPRSIQALYGAGQLSSDGSEANFYHASYWEPEHYWQLQDKLWRDVPMGEVIVHPVQEDD